MNSAGHSTPVRNLSYCVRKKAYNAVRYHSGTVIPGGTVGSNLKPKSTGKTPPARHIAPQTAITIGTSNTKNLGMCTAISPSMTMGKMKTCCA